MPTFVDGDFRIPYLTEEELLKVANAVRTAGGAQVIEAFFPSVPSDGEECLIANALNFGCVVDAREELTDRPGEYQWLIELPPNIQQYKVEAVGQAIKDLGYEDVSWDKKEKVVFLPRLIGNTAAAFDNAARGWVTKYRKS